VRKRRFPLPPFTSLYAHRVAELAVSHSSTEPSYSPAIVRLFDALRSLFRRFWPFVSENGLTCSKTLRLQGDRRAVMSERERWIQPGSLEESTATD